MIQDKQRQCCLWRRKLQQQSETRPGNMQALYDAVAGSVAWQGKSTAAWEGWQRRRTSRCRWRGGWPKERREEGGGTEQGEDPDIKPSPEDATRLRGGDEWSSEEKRQRESLAGCAQATAAGRAAQSTRRSLRLAAQSAAGAGQ